MKQIILAFFGSIFPAILFNIDRKKLIWAGFSGALGWLMYLVGGTLGGGIVINTFLGAFSVGLYSEIMARIKKAPSMQFSIPGIFPLVPGIMAYTTVKYVVDGLYDKAFVQGTQSIIVAGAIAFGIMLAATTYRFFYKAHRDMNSFKSKRKRNPN